MCKKLIAIYLGEKQISFPNACMQLLLSFSKVRARAVGTNTRYLLYFFSRSRAVSLDIG
jgi:hypothetical protein